jgi:hypothetical protein
VRCDLPSVPSRLSLRERTFFRGAKDDNDRWHVIDRSASGHFCDLRWVLTIALLVGILRDARADGPPEMFAVTPNEGAAGDTIQIKGRGFKGTIRVVFAVGQTSKDARFSVASDKELSVTVPDYYLPDVPATLAVLTSRGVTFGMPASVIRVDGKSRFTPKTGFLHVLREGMVDQIRGITLIDGAGAVRISADGALQFVKSGGRLESFHNPSGIIFYEPGAMLGDSKTKFEQYTKRIEVREINESLGIDPFLFKAPSQAEGEPKAAPRIRSISPERASISDVVVLRGTGFLGTSHVFIGNVMTPVGFKVMSDTQLRLVLPDKLHVGPPAHEAWVIVVNPKGVNVTFPSRGTTSKDGVWQVSGGRTLQIVERGQRVAEKASIVFAKNGSKITPYTPGSLFYEPDADVPHTALAEREKANKERGIVGHHVFAVDKIVVSEVPLLQITSPWQ